MTIFGRKAFANMRYSALGLTTTLRDRHTAPRLRLHNYIKGLIWLDLRLSDTNYNTPVADVS